MDRRYVDDIVLGAVSGGQTRAICAARPDQEIREVEKIWVHERYGRML